MKKILLGILLGILLLLSINSFGQITKIENEKSIASTRISPMGIFLIGANIFENRVNVSFTDTKYTTIKIYKNFNLSPKDFEDLYLLLTKEDNKEEDFYNIKTLDEKQLFIKFSKSFGVVYPIIMLTDSGVDSFVAYLTKSQIKKLFNKNK